MERYLPGEQPDVGVAASLWLEPCEKASLLAHMQECMYRLARKPFTNKGPPGLPQKASEALKELAGPDEHVRMGRHSHRGGTLGR